MFVYKAFPTLFLIIVYSYTNKNTINILYNILF